MSPQWGARCCVKMDLTVASPPYYEEKKKKKENASFVLRS